MYAAASTHPSYQIQTLESGQFKYTPTKEEKEEISDEQGHVFPGYLDANGQLLCESDVGYVVVASKAPYAAYANQRFKTLAQENMCNRDTSTTSVKPHVSFFKDEIISVMTALTTYSRGANGSCHTSYEYMNLDLQTGHQYTLANLLRTGDYAAIKKDILAYFKNKFSGSDQNETLDILGETLDDTFWNLGFYINGGKIFIDMNTYLQSCADGSHWPFLIDPKYYKEDWTNERFFGAIK